MRGFENRYELAHLISCRLMGTITPEEEERFQKWWKESESHEKEYEMICKRLIVDLRRTEHPDLHKAWSVEQTSPYEAAILVLAFGGCCLCRSDSAPGIGVDISTG